jgi:signal transduction histidine kinase
MKFIERLPVPEARLKQGWRCRLLDTLLALGGVAFVTGVIAVAHLYPLIPTISFTYLLVVLALASTRGLYAAILASLLAVLAYDFFLSPPLFVFVLTKLGNLLDLAVFLATAIITSQLASALRRRAEQAQSRERELRLLYAQAQELAALQERQRLARELHDSVTQTLYGISLGAHTAEEALESEPEQARAAIAYVIGLAEAGLAEMRALIFELRPDSLKTEGLVAALRRQVAVLRTRYKLTVDADLDDEPDLPLESKQALYRITQEAFHNIVKHAAASKVALRLMRKENEVILEVSDNGRGFDPRGAFPGHFGLRSMQERATNMNGTLIIESVPGQGTRIGVQVPV